MGLKMNHPMKKEEKTIKTETEGEGQKIEQNGKRILQGKNMKKKHNNKKSSFIQ